MKIQNLKELQKLMQLCRKQHVQSIKIDGIEFTLGKEPIQQDYTLDTFPEAQIQVPQFTGSNATEDTAIDTIQTDELTEEQMMFYSARPEAEQAQ